MAYLRAQAPQVPVILDAKRGDIGSTAEQYAKEAFERYGADAVTLSPFMGRDSVQPYLRYRGKGAFLLCRTSNPGGDDFQNQALAALPGQPRLYEHIAQLAQTTWNDNGQLGLVVGATYPQELERVRALAPTVPLLIPGVGAQGGDAQATVRAAWRGTADRTTGPIAVNASRSIIYASDATDFAQAARREAMALRLSLQAARVCST
jgi:orotidine-5'-phosphate decarboxylase